MEFNQSFPDKTAIVFGEHTWSYQVLGDTINKIAASLIQQGLQIGDRIALHLPNCPELIFCYYACFKIGAIAVPVNPLLMAPEIAYILNHSQAKICISHIDSFAEVQLIREQFAQIPTYFLVGDDATFLGVRPFSDLCRIQADQIKWPVLDDSAVAAILYTSGTTGRPKGVTHTHQSLTQMATYHAQQINLSHTDICGVALYLTHIGGFAMQMLPVLSAGATLVIIPRPDPALVLQTLQRGRVTYFIGMPVLFNALVNLPNSGDRLEALRICLGGGDTVPAVLQQRFTERFGPDIIEICGMTEVVPYTANTPQERRLGTIGKAAQGMRLRLADGQGREVSPGEVGEILVKSDALTVGYWNNPEATTQAFTEGWLRTGDLAWRDEDGYYWFVSRKKDIIVRGGANVSPLEVEGVIYQHPAVREVAVIGRPHVTWGEAAHAFVSLKEGFPITKSELQAFVSQKLAAYKVPESISFLPELPKGSTGKVHRQTLRDWSQDSFGNVQTVA
ncbi:MAG: AMP-binding protein [Leptolyngbyaceae cyanobacterium MO_188.B28]|nr:AMP-binding protein [Leptolyngbyaceae cyanobacterium MO_188.B28]